jgi:hypothetical protein
MNRNQWIAFILWFAAFNATAYFFRFRFGLDRITGVFLIIGLLLTWLFRTKDKSGSDKDINRE